MICAEEGSARHAVLEHVSASPPTPSDVDKYHPPLRPLSPRRTHCSINPNMHEGMCTPRGAGTPSLTANNLYISPRPAHSAEPCVGGSAARGHQPAAAAQSPDVLDAAIVAAEQFVRLELQGNDASHDFWCDSHWFCSNGLPPFRLPASTCAAQASGICRRPD